MGTEPIVRNQSNEPPPGDSLLFKSDLMPLLYPALPRDPKGGGFNWLVHKHYEEFDSEIMDPVQCKAEFRVEKNALRSVAETPDLRHRILNWISEN